MAKDVWVIDGKGRTIGTVWKSGKWWFGEHEPSGAIFEDPSMDGAAKEVRGQHKIWLRETRKELRELKERLEKFS